MKTCWQIIKGKATKICFQFRVVALSCPVFHLAGPQKIFTLPLSLEIVIIWHLFHKTVANVLYKYMLIWRLISTFLEPLKIETPFPFVPLISSITKPVHSAFQRKKPAFAENRLLEKDFSRRNIYILPKYSGVLVLNWCFWSIILACGKCVSLWIVSYSRS